MTDAERVVFDESSRKLMSLVWEYKELVHRVRSSRLPLADNNELDQRMLAIRRECNEKYNIDVRRY